MPRIVIAANVFESNKKFGALLALFGILALAAYIANRVISPDAFGVGMFTATDVLLIIFYVVTGLFALFLVVYLVKSGAGTKIYNFFKSGKFKETVRKVKEIAREVEETFPEAKKKLEKLTKTPEGKEPAGEKGKVPSPLEVITKLGSLFGDKAKVSANRAAALQITPAEGPAIVVVPKTRAPVEDVPRVAFLGYQRRSGAKQAVFIISINLLLVFAIILALFLTGIWIWGV